MLVLFGWVVFLPIIGYPGTPDSFFQTPFFDDRSFGSDVQYIAHRNRTIVSYEGEQGSTESDPGGNKAQHEGNIHPPST